MSKDTLHSIGLLVLRVVAGAAMATHGFAKLFGGDMSGFARGVGAMGFPAPLVFAWIAALAEFVGGFLVAVGLRTRVAAAFVFIDMSVAAFVRHAHDAFAVRELALLYWAAMAALMLIGGGRFSLDRA